MGFERFEERCVYVQLRMCSDIIISPYWMLCEAGRCQISARRLRNGYGAWLDVCVAIDLSTRSIPTVRSGREIKMTMFPLASPT